MARMIQASQMSRGIMPDKKTNLGLADLMGGKKKVDTENLVAPYQEHKPGYVKPKPKPQGPVGGLAGIMMGGAAGAANKAGSTSSSAGSTSSSATNKNKPSTPAGVRMIPRDKDKSGLKVVGAGSGGVDEMAEYLNEDSGLLAFGGQGTRLRMGRHVALHACHVVACMHAFTVPWQALVCTSSLQTQCGVNSFILDSRRVLAPAPKLLGLKHIFKSRFCAILKKRGAILVIDLPAFTSTVIECFLCAFTSTVIECFLCAFTSTVIECFFCAFIVSLGDSPMGVAAVCHRIRHLQAQQNAPRPLCWSVRPCNCAPHDCGVVWVWCICLQLMAPFFCVGRVPTLLSVRGLHMSLLLLGVWAACCCYCGSHNGVSKRTLIQNMCLMYTPCMHTGVNCSGLKRAKFNRNTGAAEKAFGDTNFKLPLEEKSEMTLDNILGESTVGPCPSCAPRMRRI